MQLALASCLEPESDLPVVSFSGDYGRFNPRDYQRRAIERAMELLLGDSPGCIVRLPTGCGKTFTGSWIGQRWMELGDDRYVLVLAHERQLVHQFAQEIEDVLDVRPGIEMGSDGSVHFDGPYHPRIVVASRATLYERGEGDERVSRLYKFPKEKKWLVIIDEAHRWKWSLRSCRHILEHFASNPASRRLGLSATPERGDKVSLARLFPDVALDYRLYDLDGGPSAVNDGWAVPYDQRFISVEGLDWKNIAEVSGDFAEDELERVLGEQEQIVSMVTPMLDLVGERRTIIFSVTKNMAHRVAQTINGRRPGAAVSLNGDHPESYRQQVYAAHRRGDFQFLSICMLCREGYNDPGIGAVAIFRPTKSRVLAEQMKGRGCRPLRGLVDGLDTAEERIAAIAASAKPNCIIIDLVGASGLGQCATTAHILAAGKPDEVIERANANALAKAGDDTPLDMADEIRNAEAELAAEEEERKAEQARREKEESERAERARLERERRERDEAERLGKLQADVHYTVQRVEAGDLGGSHTRQASDSTVRMLFGKHRGQPIDCVPTHYLEWIKDKIQSKKSQWFKHAIGLELDRRRREVGEQQATPQASGLVAAQPLQATPGQRRVLAKYGKRTDVSESEARALIAEINRELEDRRRA